MAGELGDFRFAVEGLGGRGGAAGVREGEDLDDEVSRIVADGEGVAEFDFAGGFGRLTVEGDAAELAGAGGEGAGFKEARGPEEFVHADGGHGFIFSRIGVDVIKAVGGMRVARARWRRRVGRMGMARVASGLA